VTTRTRVANWPLVLNQKVNEWRLRPFAWGTSDCCQWVAEVVTAITGEDYRDLFPAYETQEDAEQILAQSGGIAGILASALGEPKPVAWAKRGDIVMADFGLGATAAVCLGLYCWAPGEKGLVCQPTRTATAAWEV
jgi:hypothetical protein